MSDDHVTKYRREKTSCINRASSAIELIRLFVYSALNSKRGGWRDDIFIMIRVSVINGRTETEEKKVEQESRLILIEEIRLARPSRLFFFLFILFFFFEPRSYRLG